MKQMQPNPTQKTPNRYTRLAALAAALLCLGLLSATPAAALYEQVGNFSGTPGVLKLAGGTDAQIAERWPEEVQLGGVGGMAVNYTGAGGVPAGTVYAATGISTATSNTRVARFNPDGSFSERWTFEGSPAPKERCGPDGDPAHPVCESVPTGPPNVSNARDVDVDQTTGYVYVLNGYLGFGQNLIHVYSADGSKLIDEFGERDDTFGGTTAASPEKIHGSLRGSIAVNGSGEVYVSDRASGGGKRLMVFRPQSPGDYENYVYAGQGHDIWAEPQFEEPAFPVADAAGNLYVASDKFVAKLDPSQPTAPALCEFKFPTAGIVSLTVDPLSGEVFFFSENNRKIHHLEACEEGKFVEAGKPAFVPPRRQIGGLAVDPAREYALNRPAGVLYAGAPASEGGKTEGTFPNNLVESAMGYVFAKPVALPPEILSESFSHVTASTAQLAARLNPKSSATQYVFQYLTQAEYEANEPADRFSGASESPLGGALAGEGAAPVDVAASLRDLLPDTAYRFRVVATSHCNTEDPEELCESTGEGKGFHTYPVEAPGLPDGRVYELVSPIEKSGGQVLPADPRTASCLEQDQECKPGWFYNDFPIQSTADGNAIAYEGTPFASEEGTVSENEYLARRDPKTGWHTVNLTPTQLQGLYRAFTPDLGQTVIEQEAGTLSPEAPGEYDNLYFQPTDDPFALKPLLLSEPPNRISGTLTVVYQGASSDLSRIFFEANDALTEETPFAPEAVDGGELMLNLYEWHEGQIALVNVMPGNAETKPRPQVSLGGLKAVSADGSRVLFADETGQLYVREDAEETSAIPDAGKYLRASLDGSKVLLDNGHLYDLEAEGPGIQEIADLTEGEGGFQGLVGESEDLSRLYFVATAALTGEEANEGKEKAEAGKYNLYSWQEGTGTSFVAQLLAEDGEKGGNAILSAWNPFPASRTAEASPNGRFLTFLSRAQLSGYDNTGICKTIASGPPVVFGPGPCQQVFLYDSQSGELSCPSCNPSGLSPRGWSTLRRGTIPQARYLTDSGRLYFDSQDMLVPADTNGRVEDVYQFEPSGVGDCKRAVGCLALISAGTGTVDSNFLAADPTGKNVFITTRDQLVLKDKDELIDLYTAREGGGIPGETEAGRGECQGEACQPLVTPPNDPTPGSSTFEGAGNVDEQKAAKKKKSTKKKRKQAKKKKSAHKRAAKHNRGGSK